MRPRSAIDLARVTLVGARDEAGLDLDGFLGSRQEALRIAGAFGTGTGMRRC